MSEAEFSATVCDSRLYRTGAVINIVMWSLFGCSGILQTCGRACQQVATAGATRRARARAAAGVSIGPGAGNGGDDQAATVEDGEEAGSGAAVRVEEDDADRAVRVEEDDDQPVMVVEEQQPEEGRVRVQVVERGLPAIASDV
jgi:hypothetical protein